MQTGNDCLVCFLRQALATIRRSTTDPHQHWQLTTEVGAMLSTFDPQIPPPGKCRSLLPPDRPTDRGGRSLCR